MGCKSPTGKSFRHSVMSPTRGERWPEAVAAGISLLEVALGPEIVEEAFAIIMGMDTFGAACRRADGQSEGERRS